MIEAYKSIKSLVGQTTEGRLNYIDEETRKMGLAPQGYEIASPRGTDTHLVVNFDFDRPYDLWLSANYDTFENLPSANNNGSGATALLMLGEKLQQAQPPVNVRLVYFDAGLDPDLVTKKRRNPDFVPGSRLFLDHLLTTQLDFIDSYEGLITVQAVGKGDLSVFQVTGKKLENDNDLNKLIVNHGSRIKVPVDLREQSPNADNLAFLEEGLRAAVLARYHEGSWHRMQSKDDDFTNISTKAIEETVMFLQSLISDYSTNSL